jgi:hypothetical protein
VPAGTAGGDQEGGDPDAGVDGAAFTRARIRKEVALAGLRELELAQLRGQLITIDFADAQLETAFEIVRQRLLNLPSIAPRLAELSGISAIQAALQAEVDRILVALSTSAVSRAAADTP